MILFTIARQTNSQSGSICTWAVSRAEGVSVCLSLTVDHRHLWYSQQSAELYISSSVLPLRRWRGALCMRQITPALPSQSCRRKGWVSQTLPAQSMHPILPRPNKQPSFLRRNCACHHNEKALDSSAVALTTISESWFYPGR
jgi:hypothetical protein